MKKLFLTFTEQDSERIANGDYSCRIEPPDVFESVDDAVKSAMDYDCESVLVWEVVGVPVKRLRLKQTIIEDLPSEYEPATPPPITGDSHAAVIDIAPPQGA